MKGNLDQQRARFAWEQVATLGDRADEYCKLAKGAPALIMTSGLMPTLAFYREKGGDARSPHKLLLTHLCGWLKEQFRSRVRDTEFMTVMGALRGSANTNAAEQARFYQRATAETMELLRWIRHFSAVVAKEPLSVSKGNRP